MVVDRQNRDLLIAAIHRYLDGETTAFQFDHEVFAIKSSDHTISHVAWALWGLYDDLKEHKVMLSKEGWDFVQRLILILQSDGYLEVTKQRRWDSTQLASLAALVSFILAVRWLGFGIQLIVLAIPFGIVSLAISKWRVRREKRATRSNSALLVPFSSFSELISLRRAVANFRKRQYPAGVKPFCLRTPLEELAITLHFYATWFLLSPLVLFFQAMPMAVLETRVVMEGTTRQKQAIDC